MTQVKVIWMFIFNFFVDLNVFEVKKGGKGTERQKENRKKGQTPKKENHLF